MTNNELPGPDSGADRRSTPRLDSHERAVVRRLDDESEASSKEYSCGVLDVSQEGLRIFSRQYLSVGDEIEVTIERTGYGRAHTLLGVVRWSTPSLEVSGHFLGVQFLNERDLATWKKTFH